MKKKWRVIFGINTLFLLLILTISSCKKDYFRWSLPKKVDLKVSIIDIKENSILIKGEILSGNTGKIELAGFKVVKGKDFSLANNYSQEINGTNAYTLNFTGFDYSAYYEAQFYVTTEAGESKSISVGFTTPNIPGSPSVLLQDATNIFIDNFTANANVTLEGTFPVVERGFCWSTIANPTIFDNKSINGSGSGNFSYNIINLSPETTYYVRAYATNQIATSYSNQIEVKTKSISGLSFGESYQGGIFFYLYQPGDIGYISGEVHGLLAAPQDQGNFPWGCQGANINTSDAIGAGINNTQLILNTCGENNIAAKICNNLSLNGYNDWFLPSRAELQLMYQNLHQNGFGDFSTTPGANDYWSSSQFNNVSAWYRSFAVNSQNTGNKTGTLKIRAIRKF
jgi:hypothetical protein